MAKLHSTPGGTLRIFCALAFLLLSASSFQSRYYVSSPSIATRCRAVKQATFLDFDHSYAKRRNVATFLSNDNNSQTNNKDYDDIAFGFIFLGGYITTQDIFFTGTFLLLSAVAAIATRNGKLPAKTTVPAAVAGLTLLVSQLLPKEQLYEVLPYIPKAEPSLPIDTSLVQAGLCTVSMFYGFLSSDDEDVTSQ